MGKTVPLQTASIVRRWKRSEAAGQLPAAALLFLRGSLVFLPILKIRVMKLSGIILFSHLFHFFFTHFGRAEGI